MSMWSWGANSHGQLGQDVINEQVTKANEVEKQLWEDIEYISCGGGHTLMIDIRGQLHGCGWNSANQLALDDAESSTFQRIWKLSGIRFTKISCGWDFSSAVSDDKFLFVWGSNSYGQLGLPRKHYPKVVKPIRLEVNACHMSMGLRHTVIVNSKGEVWITGNGKFGQLGLGTEIKEIDRFTKVPNIGPISHIACGQNHTIAWSTEESVLYVWGDNKHGQLLLDTNKYPRIYLPQKIDIDIKARVLKLLSGWTNAALWLETERLITWGRNNYGQLGTGSNKTDHFNNISLPGGRKIKDIALGSEHTICLATDGSLWSWGWNEHGNTGTKESADCIFTPTPVQFDHETYEIKSIFAGSGHNFIVGKSATL